MKLRNKLLKISKKIEEKRLKDILGKYFPKKIEYRDVKLFLRKPYSANKEDLKYLIKISPYVDILFNTKDEKLKGKLKEINKYLFYTSIDFIEPKLIIWRNKSPISVVMKRINIDLSKTLRNMINIYKILSKQRYRIIIRGINKRYFNLDVLTKPEEIIGIAYNKKYNSYFVITKYYPNYEILGNKTNLFKYIEKLNQLGINYWDYHNPGNLIGILNSNDKIKELRLLDWESSKNRGNKLRRRVY